MTTLTLDVRPLSHSPADFARAGNAGPADFGVHTLLDAGVLRKSGDGRIGFPYDAVRVEFPHRAD